MCFPASDPSAYTFLGGDAAHDFLVKHKVWPLTCSPDWRNSQAFKPASNFSRFGCNSTLCSTFLPWGQPTYSSSALGEQFSEKQPRCGVLEHIPECGVAVAGNLHQRVCPSQPFPCEIWIPLGWSTQELQQDTRADPAGPDNPRLDTEDNAFPGPEEADPPTAKSCFRAWALTSISATFGPYFSLFFPTSASWVIC